MKMVLKEIRTAGYLMLVLGVVISCKQKKDAESTREVPADYIYMDYQVRGDEGNDSVTILANFREFDQYGYSLKLDTPAVVRFDGEAINGTTLEIPGTYYEVQKSLATFGGQHTISFINPDGKVFEEAFRFEPMVLRSPVPPVVNDTMLILDLDGIDSGDVVHVLLTDTSYAGEGIERIDTVKNGQITLTRTDLNKLADGPVQLELQRENIRPVFNRGEIAGKIAILYGLRRGFTLSRKPD